MEMWPLIVWAVARRYYHSAQGGFSRREADRLHHDVIRLSE
jgi:hypothetical protein